MGTGWRRVAELIRAEAGPRFGTARKFATAAGVSTRTVEDLMAGKRTRYRPATIHGVEAALGWEHGSITRIVEGGQPRPAADPHLAVLLDAWPHLSARDRRVLLAVVEALRR